jgi:hypothetical protein
MEDIMANKSFEQYKAEVQAQQSMSQATPTESDYLVGHICGTKNNRSFFRIVPVISYHAVALAAAGDKDASGGLIEWLSASASQLPNTDGHTNVGLETLLAQYFGARSGFSRNMAQLALRAKSDKAPGALFANGRPVAIDPEKVVGFADEVARQILMKGQKERRAPLDLLPLNFDAKLLNSALIGQVKRTTDNAFRCMPILMETEIPVLQRMVATSAGADIFSRMKDFAKRLNFVTPGSYNQAVILAAASAAGYDKDGLLLMAAEQQKESAVLGTGELAGSVVL